MDLACNHRMPIDDFHYFFKIKNLSTNCRPSIHTNRHFPMRDVDSIIISIFYVFFI